MNNFRKNLVVKGYNETIRILNLQKAFKKKQVKVKDIPEEDIDELNTLYRKQIQELEQSIEKDKQKLQKLQNDVS